MILQCSGERAVGINIRFFSGLRTFLFKRNNGTIYVRSYVPMISDICSSSSSRFIQLFFRHDLHTFFINHIIIELRTQETCIEGVFLALHIIVKLGLRNMILYLHCQCSKLQHSQLISLLRYISAQLHVFTAFYRNKNLEQ